MMRGVVFSGSRNCSRWWTEEVCRALRDVLGYVPVPGSLNLAMFDQFKLRRSGITFWDQRRPRTGKRGGTYQFWPARFGLGEFSASGHVMRPDTRGHGNNCLELVAPIVLRDVWSLKDGSRLWVKL